MRRVIPTPSMAVALVALLIALSGSAFAVTKIGTRQIESNAVTELEFATAGDDRGIVTLGCRTEVASGYGPVPTRWWIEVRRMPDGRWLIDRLAWLSLMNQAPAPGSI